MEIGKTNNYPEEYVYDRRVFTQCTGGGPVFVYVKNGRIVRIRPITFTSDDAPPFRSKHAGGHSFPKEKPIFHHSL
jgi:trimethylamine-N-oxide reductase (cytochrome c)